jgi:hypothetical protein
MNDKWVLSNVQDSRDMISHMYSKCLRTSFANRCEYEKGIDLITGEFDKNNELKKLTRSIIFCNGGPDECFSPPFWKCDKTLRGDWQCIQRNDALSHILKIEDFAKESN